MNNRNRYLDTSPELCLIRYQNGIKLIRPEQLASDDNSNQKITSSVANVLKSPFGVYFYNYHSEFQNINENHVESCGFDSIKEALGKTVRATAIDKFAAKLLEHNESILKSHEMKIFEEEIMHYDGVYSRGISIKLPWYDTQNKIIGIFGCTILLDRHLLTDSLRHITDMGLLTPYQPYSPSEFPSRLNREIAQTSLSKRETQICQHLIRGKTARAIAELLNISPRTVEQHIVNIKIKLAVRSKSELINKIIDTLI